MRSASGGNVKGRSVSEGGLNGPAAAARPDEDTTALRGISRTAAPTATGLDPGGLRVSESGSFAVTVPV
jgi:hypothetical protein